MTSSPTRAVLLKSLDDDGLESKVGNAPIRLGRIAAGLPAQVHVYAKAEWFNPNGSVKDRAAINIMRSAVANGNLGNGRRFQDSTSGNTGIACATFGPAIGMPAALCVPAAG